MFNIGKHKNKGAQIKVVINPTKIQKISTKVYEYGPKNSILIGQGENEKCKFVELSGDAKIDENGIFTLTNTFENNTLA
jgi:hypothetical protein